MTTQRWIESFHVSFHSRCAVRWFIICDNITSRARPVVSRRAHTYIKLYVPTCVSCVCFRVKVCYICVLVWICVNGCCARYIAYINVIPKPQIYYSATLELQTAHSHSSLLAHSPHCVCRRCVCVCVSTTEAARRATIVWMICVCFLFIFYVPHQDVWYTTRARTTARRTFCEPIQPTCVAAETRDTQQPERKKIRFFVLIYALDCAWKPMETNTIWRALVVVYILCFSRCVTQAARTDRMQHFVRTNDGRASRLCANPDGDDDAACWVLCIARLPHILYAYILRSRRRLQLGNMLVYPVSVCVHGSPTYVCSALILKATGICVCVPSRTLTHCGDTDSVHVR